MWCTDRHAGETPTHIKSKCKNDDNETPLFCTVLWYRGADADSGPGQPAAFFPSLLFSSRFFFLFWKWFNHLTFWQNGSSLLLLLLLSLSVCIYACLHKDMCASINPNQTLAVFLDCSSSYSVGQVSVKRRDLWYWLFWVTTLLSSSSLRTGITGGWVPGFPKSFPYTCMVSV